jgi:hypothetical protein
LLIDKSVLEEDGPNLRVILLQAVVRKAAWYSGEMLIGWLLNLVEIWVIYALLVLRVYIKVSEANNLIG